MLMILMNLQAAPEENAGALGADELGSVHVGVCVRAGGDGVALVIKMNYSIAWPGGRGETELSQNASLLVFGVPDTRGRKWASVFACGCARRMRPCERVHPGSRAPSWIGLEVSEQPSATVSGK